MSADSDVGMLIVAAGVGSRAGGGDVPKQYRAMAGVPLLSRTVRAALACPALTQVGVVIHRSHVALYNALGLEDTRLLPPIVGADTRQGSVLAGLEALAVLPPALVLIQDAARPFLNLALIDGVIEKLADHDAVLPVVPVTDTVKSGKGNGLVERTLDRDGLYAAQTPQGFRFAAILDAHRKAAKSQQVFTDDASIAEWAGMEVAMSSGDHDNLKVTTNADFARAEQILDGARVMETRVGSGTDVHAFEAGDGVTLGGVLIPHSAKLKGHSDADAGLHVLTDALLGALAEGDIGTHFPPSDPKWKGAPSSTFLSFAAGRVAARGGRIVNLDLTLMCEAPKIGPHATAMRAAIAGICGIDISRVSVKATTSEGMGFVGRGEGLMAFGSATIEVPRGGD